jgi:glycosyltransferase involved in cell wall biosynthesis
MKKNPKISVIIPVYNGEKTLKQCLDSVLNQNYKNYEVIVVDNNSTDRTKEIIKEFQKKEKGKNKKIKYLFESKQGRGAARYKGEINSKGEIILMTDSDCIVPKNWVQEIIEPIIKDKQIAVQGTIKPIFTNYWSDHIQKEIDEQIIKKKKEEKIEKIMTGNFAIKKDILKKIGYTNPNLIYNEDTDLEIRFKIKKYPISFKKYSVLHNHPNTAIIVFKKFLKRGEWNSRINKKYKFREEEIHQENPFRNINYFCSIFLELLTLHKNLKYDFVTGIAWRAGSFYGWIKK